MKKRNIPQNKKIKGKYYFPQNKNLNIIQRTLLTIKRNIPPNKTINPLYKRIERKYRKIKGKYSFPPNKRIDFIIIGVQKCGTTALFTFLNQHPNLIGSTHKEISFFNLEHLYKLGYDYYHSFFKFKSYNDYYFEASSLYLQYNNSISAKRIFEYNPNIKLIVLIRDPIKRAYSAFNMYRSFWYSDPNWFDMLKMKEINYIKRSYKDYNNFNFYINHEIEAIKNNKKIEAPIINYGKYYYGIKKFIEVFGNAQIFIIENTMLSKNTYKILNEILSFLGINKKYKWDFPDGKIVFGSKYEIPLNKAINKVTLDKLREIYHKPNEKLFKLIKKRYDWIS